MAMGRMQDIPVPAFVNQPSFEAPLKKHRLLFNDMHTESANRIYKSGENSNLRLNAGYTHDERSQQRGSETSYFTPGETHTVKEETDTRVRSDEADLTLNYEKNGEKNFLTNHFDLKASRERSSNFFADGEISAQRINTDNLTARNELKNIWNKDKYTLENGSLLRFSHLPSLLTVDNAFNQNRKINHFYADNYFAVLRKKGYNSIRLTTGIKGQASNYANQYSPYIAALLQRNATNWNTSLTLPVNWNKFPGNNVSRFSVNPSLLVRYKLNYAWQFRLFGRYEENYGNITDFAKTPYYSDYRHIYRNNGKLPIDQAQTYSLYAEYKNVIREFFATLSLTHYRNRVSQSYERSLENNTIIFTARDIPAHSDGWTINGTISKGIYDWHMKASLNYILSTRKGEQLIMGNLIPYRTSYLFLEPMLSLNPVQNLEIDYQSSFRYGGTRFGNDDSLSPLWNIVRKLKVSYHLKPFELIAGAEHYYNDVSADRDNNGKSINAIFIDLSLRWDLGKWQIGLSANNLLDKRQYGYTTYSALESYTSWVKIRGREIMATVKLKL